MVMHRYKYKKDESLHLLFVLPSNGYQLTITVFANEKVSHIGENNNDSVNFLGLHFDKHLTWNNRIKLTLVARID